MNRAQKRVIAGPVSMTNRLVGFVEYGVVPSHAALRILFSFFNPTPNDITTKIELFSDLGSDEETHVSFSSSNDSKLTAADRWVITDDQQGEADPVMTNVFFGKFAYV